eukprot:1161884-Pelagomonas_calceolata.AAC.5
MSFSRVMGQQLSSGRPCIPALLNTHNWLANPQTAFLISQSNNTSYIVIILEFGIGLLHVCLHAACGPHPCACGTDSGLCTLIPLFCFNL